ncbi:hypothetical protein ACG7TL_005559 [Trametes sanguinea]
MSNPPTQLRTAAHPTTRLENLRAMVDAALRPNPPVDEETTNNRQAEALHDTNRWASTAYRVPGLCDAMSNHLVLLAADALTRGVPVPGLDDLAGAITVLRPHPLPHPRSPVTVLEELVALYTIRLKSGEIPYPQHEVRTNRVEDRYDWTQIADHASAGRAVFNSEHRGDIIARARGIVLAYGYAAGI